LAAIADFGKGLLQKLPFLNIRANLASKQRLNVLYKLLIYINKIN
jgi:hypothetical protein